jgi:hypothetical protein
VTNSTSTFKHFKRTSPTEPKSRIQRCITQDPAIAELSSTSSMSPQKKQEPHSATAITARYRTYPSTRLTYTHFAQLTNHNRNSSAPTTALPPRSQRHLSRSLKESRKSTRRTMDREVCCIENSVVNVEGGFWNMGYASFICHSSYIFSFFSKGRRNKLILDV